MRQPPWKRLVSYITELHIESAPSDLNPHLYVSLSRGRYQLATRNAIYSFEDLYDNFKRAFGALDWTRFDPRECLLLGVGLGSVPQLLEQTFDKPMHFTGVEADENVLYLAEKYVLNELKSGFEMHCCDAAAFVRGNSSEFDLICMDVFVDDVIPEEMQSAEYLEQLKSALSQNGLLMYNRLSRTKEDVDATNEFLYEVFLEVFPKGGYLDVGGNWMLLSRKDFLKRS